MQVLFNNHKKSIVICILGALINALAVNCFVLSSDLGEGGTIGISLALKYTLNLSPALTSFIINVVVILVGWKYLSKTTAVYTLIYNIFISVFLGLTEMFNFNIDDFMINSLFGGVLIGVGAGLVIATGGTVGGTSVIAKMFNKYFDIKTSQAIFVLDGLVVLSFLLVLPLKNVLFTIVLLFATERATSFIIEGFNPKKAVTIISKKNEIINDKINEFTGRGSTLVEGKGGYTKEDTSILYIVVPQSQVTSLKKLVNKEDNDAFLVIHDVRDVLGRGFINAS